MTTWLADRDFTTAAGPVANGTVAGQRWQWAATSAGRTVVEQETVWRMHVDAAPDWPTGDWSIRIRGEPEMHVALPHHWNRDVLGSTAAHAVNAIPYVAAAQPGIVTFLDLPLVAGRGAVRGRGPAGWWHHALLRQHGSRRRPARSTLDHMTEAGAHAASGWSGTWWLSSRWLRRRWAAMIPVLVIVAVGTAGAAIAVSTADRTSRAYGEFVQRAVVGDVVLNPSVSTQLVDDLIRALPGVERVTSDTVLATTMDDGRPRTRAAIEARAVDLFVHGSTDGKFVDMDRPVVQLGSDAGGPGRGGDHARTPPRSLGSLDRRRRCRSPSGSRASPTSPVARWRSSSPTR